MYHTTLPPVLHEHSHGVMPCLSKTTQTQGVEHLDGIVRGGTSEENQYRFGSWDIFLFQPSCSTSKPHCVPSLGRINIFPQTTASIRVEVVLELVETLTLSTYHTTKQFATTQQSRRQCIRRPLPTQLPIPHSTCKWH